MFTLNANTGDVIGSAVPFTVGIATYGLAVNAAQTKLYAVDANNNRLATVALDAQGDPQSATPFAVPDGGAYPIGIYAR